MDKRRLYAQIVHGVAPQILEPVWAFNEGYLNPLPMRLSRVRVDNGVYAYSPQKPDLEMFFRGEFEDAKLPTMAQIKKRAKDKREPLKLQVQEADTEYERHQKRIQKGRQLRTFRDNGYHFINPKNSR